MEKTSTRLIITLVAVLAAVAYWWSDGFGMRKPEAARFIVTDFYSLVMTPDEKGGCQSAVGYKEKYMIGVFTAQQVRHLTCAEYYFNEKPQGRYQNTPIVLLRLENGEYHWVLASHMDRPLGD
jgi:hypothetical protein